jgi:hypothetical protein
MGKIDFVAFSRDPTRSRCRPYFVIPEGNLRLPLRLSLYRH